MDNSKEEGKKGDKKSTTPEKVLERITKENKQLASALNKILKNSNKPKTKE